MESPSPELPQTRDVINAAFASDVGIDTDPLQLPGGGLSLILTLSA